MKRHNQMQNGYDNNFVEEGEDDAMIANEFPSDEDEQEDMNEFMEHEEEFEARQSISSRGRETRTQMMPGENRPTDLQEISQRPQNHEKPHDYQQHQYAYGEGDDEESVVSEIVSERIVEMKSEGEYDNEQEYQNKDDGINNYLNNIKQEDYVNREEYQMSNHEQSPYKGDDQKQEQYKNIEQNYMQFNDPNEQYEEEEEQQQMQDHGLYQNNMYENSPIVENPIEEEMTASPQYYEAPRAINPKLRK